MSAFDKRREGMEGKFALDEEQKFKAVVRRNKLVGLWAAERLGLSGAAADDYAATVVKADFQEPGDQDIIRKLNTDFTAQGVAVSHEQIHAELAARMAEVLAQAAR